MRCMAVRAVLTQACLLQRLKRMAEAMEVGIVWLNCSQPCFCQAPWGGVKVSGH